MSESEKAKLCSCRCGCRHPVEDVMEDRCEYCNEWHDLEGLEEEDE